MRTVIPRPVLFNCWKHHLGFLLFQVRGIKKREQLLWLKENLLKIGQSTTDLYTGSIQPSDCARLAIRELKKNDLMASQKYVSWIKESGDDYRTLLYPDDSVWVFRIGIVPGRPVHLHPGKGTPHTRRVKATILKTAITLACYIRMKKQYDYSLEDLNFVRKELIGLPIIEKFPGDSEISRMISLFLNL